MKIKNRLLYLVCCWIAFSTHSIAQDDVPPNVVIIITDDQGYGDLGITGNPHVQTPAIDRLARESISFRNFYVSPVCAPTRSSLMTGRYSLRTGVRDTYNGGAIMAPSEVTIAEMLKQADYTTGAFGKWHLGDTYPSRPSDQGFDESVIHLSGGMGQVGDFTTYFQGDSSYFDPVLWHNNTQESYTGYCSDIFAEQAIQFIERNHQQPFFCYLSFNAPHTPLQVPDEYYQLYRNIDPASGFENDSRPFPEMTEKDKEDARKVYAMVTNIDDNIDRLLGKLDELNLTENTLVIFMTDNGPQQRRYVGGMRGRKGDVYRGGVRVPFYIRYPKLFDQSGQIDAPAAHIDVLPTLANICNVNMPTDRKIDGQSLLPLINKETPEWVDRSLFFYWTRRYPETYYNMALMKGQYKIVGHTDFNADISEFELFQIGEDPYEQHNLIGEHEELAQAMKVELDNQYQELVTSENLVDPPRILIGTPHENPVYLNRNDAGGARGIWAQEEIYGQWRVHIEAGHYDIKFKFVKPVKGNGRMYLEANTLVKQLRNDRGETDIIEMKNVYIPDTNCDLITFYKEGGRNVFPFWVEMKRID